MAADETLVVCPHCDESNGRYRQTCRHCGASLPFQALSDSASTSADAEMVVEFSSEHLDELLGQAQMLELERGTGADTDQSTRRDTPLSHKVRGWLLSRNRNTTDSDTLPPC